jgi:hypothetical protein
MAGAVAAFTTSALTQGTHSITAVYSGDANNLTSTSPVVQQVVNAPGPPPPPPPPPAPGQAIPTLSELALLLLGMLVATIGMARINRSRR